MTASCEEAFAIYRLFFAAGGALVAFLREVESGADVLEDLPVVLGAGDDAAEDGAYAWSGGGHSRASRRQA